MCYVALPCCLFDLACFFLPSFSSLIKHVCIYIYTCTYYTDGSINSSSTSNGDVDGVAGNGSGKAAKLSSAWCVCRWLISCMKKDEPAVGATTFQNNPHNTPEVRRHIHMHTQTHTQRTLNIKLCNCIHCFSKGVAVHSFILRAPITHTHTHTHTHTQTHTHTFMQASHKYLLNPMPASDNKKCVVIDLDETLVHSSFKVGG